MGADRLLRRPDADRALRITGSDRLLQSTLLVVSLITAALLALIVAFIVKETWPALVGNDGVGAPSAPGITRFITDAGWHPLENSFGMLPMLWGTLASTALAALIATPLGLGAALFCHTFAPSWLVRPFRAVIALLAGIPSVVFGFWQIHVTSGERAP